MAERPARGVDSCAAAFPNFTRDHSAPAVGGEVRLAVQDNSHTEEEIVPVEFTSVNGETVDSRSRRSACELRTEVKDHGKKGVGRKDVVVYAPTEVVAKGDPVKAVFEISEKETLVKERSV